MTAIKGWRLVGAIGAALLVAAIAGWLFYTLFVAPDVAKQAAAQSKADVGGAKAQAETAGDAVTTGERISRTREIIERTTRENTIRIMAAPGAGDPIPAAVGIELDRALGLRHAYQGDSAGERVPDPATGIGAQGDAGG